jgi:hypothetical protein
MTSPVFALFTSKTGSESFQKRIYRGWNGSTSGYFGVELEAFLPELEVDMADCFQLGGFQSPERSKKAKKGIRRRKNG